MHPLTIYKQLHTKSFSISTLQYTTELKKMESGFIFPDLGGVQNGEHFNTSSMSSSGEHTTKSKRLTNSKKKEILCTFYH